MVATDSKCSAERSSKQVMVLHILITLFVISPSLLGKQCWDGGVDKKNGVRKACIYEAIY